MLPVFFCAKIFLKKGFTFSFVYANIYSDEGNMKGEQDMKKGARCWCWWMSRYLYFEGMCGNRYKFVDIADAVVYMSAEDVKKLVVK